MQYDFWWASSTLLPSSHTYLFDFRKLDSDLYAHVKACGHLQGIPHEVRQSGSMHGS